MSRSPEHSKSSLAVELEGSSQRRKASGTLTKRVAFFLELFLSSVSCLGNLVVHWAGLDEELLNVGLDGGDLGLELAALVDDDRRRDDRPRDTACPAQSWGEGTVSEIASWGADFVVVVYAGSLQA